jgi:hypothetical protein
MGCHVFLLAAITNNKECSVLFQQCCLYAYTFLPAVRFLVAAFSFLPLKLRNIGFLGGGLGDFCGLVDLCMVHSMKFVYGSATSLQ